MQFINLTFYGLKGLPIKQKDLQKTTEQTSFSLFMVKISI